MKHCLVTGGAGFIGSHLVERLLALGNRVSVIDDESTGTIDNLAAVLKHPRLSYTKGTVGDAELVRRLVADADEVYHLAAAVGVALIAQHPIHTIETNIYTTELLLRELGRLVADGRDVKFFMASTSEVYGKNPKEQWTEEDDLVFGPTIRARWSYGASKAIDEFLALAYWRERKLPTVVGRFFKRRRAASDGGLRHGVAAVCRRGAGRAAAASSRRRSAAAVFCARERCGADGSGIDECPAAVGGVFNIGSDQPVSILELAKRVIAAVDPALQTEFISYAQAYSEDFEDCRRRVPDLSKLRDLTGLRAEYGLDDVIRELVAWKRARKDRT